MKLFGTDALATFKLRHPLSRNAIDNWINITSKAKWKNIEDLRTDFKTVDYIPSRSVYCFNIKGNHFRLIAKIRFNRGAVTVNEIFTHAEYDRWNQKRQ